MSVTSAAEKRRYIYRGADDLTFTKVVNIRKYMLAALYNAPATMDSYYVSQVNHDREAEGKKLRGRIGRFKDYRYAEGESL